MQTREFVVMRSHGDGPLKMTFGFLFITGILLINDMVKNTYPDRQN